MPRMPYAEIVAAIADQVRAVGGEITHNDLVEGAPVLTHTRPGNDTAPAATSATIAARTNSLENCRVCITVCLLCACCTTACIVKQ